jgi:DNA-directed RNA polymerase beta subunit
MELSLSQVQSLALAGLLSTQCRSDTPIDSFNQFLHRDLPRLIAECRVLSMSLDGKRLVEMQLKDPRIIRPLQNGSVKNGTRSDKKSTMYQFRKSPVAAINTSSDYVFRVVATLVVREFHNLPADDARNPPANAYPLDKQTPNTAAVYYDLPLAHQWQVLDFPVCDMPAMLGSDACWTSRLHDPCLPSVDMDPRNPLGTFVLGGHIRGFRPNKDMRDNMLFAGSTGKFQCRCQRKSTRSTSTLFFHCTPDRPNEVFMNLPNMLPQPLPVALIFRVLGVSTLKEAVIAIGGCRVRDPRVHEKLADMLRTPLNPKRTAANIALLHRVRARLGKGPTAPVRAFDLSVQEAYEYTMMSMANNKTRVSSLYYTLLFECMPQAGSLPDRVTRFKKVALLGMLVHRILFERSDIPSRDDQESKKLVTPGAMMALLMRQLLRLGLSDAKKKLDEILKNDQVMPDFTELMPIHDIVTKSMMRAFRTGDMVASKKRRNNNTGMTPPINSTNMIGTFVDVSRMRAAVPEQGRHTDMRMRHPSEYGYQDLMQTPEGKQVGLLTTPSLISIVRTEQDSSLLWAELVRLMGVVPVNCLVRRLDLGKSEEEMRAPLSDMEKNVEIEWMKNADMNIHDGSNEMERNGYCHYFLRAGNVTTTTVPAIACEALPSLAPLLAYGSDLVVANGDLVGTLPRGVSHRAFAEGLREYRRRHWKAWGKVTILITPFGVELRTGDGVQMRPVFMQSELHKLPVVLSAWLSARMNVGLYKQQWSRLVYHACIDRSVTHGMWDMLCERGFVVYMASEEQKQYPMALTLQQMTDRTRFVDIHPLGAFGMVSALVPHANMQPSSRTTFVTSMFSQAPSVPNEVVDGQSMSHASVYLHRPIARTLAEETLPMMRYNPPGGCNVTLAIACMLGNEEDGLTVNKCSLERGFGSTLVAKTVAGDMVRTPSHQITIEHRGLTASASRVIQGRKMGDTAYQVLDEHGIARVGSIVRKGDVVIGRVLRAKKDDAHVYHDASIVHEDEEEMVVTQVRHVQTNRGSQVRVRLCAMRLMQVGDKLTSRHGQKGVLCRIEEEENLPFDPVTGVRPTLVMNPHSFPGRMTMSQLVEAVNSRLATAGLEIADVTPFQEGESADRACEGLERAGFHWSGRRMMMCGVTGVPMEYDMFVSDSHYMMPLHHQAQPKAYAVSNAKKNPTTGQPQEGRGDGGGMACGNMEIDALNGHGAASTIRDIHAINSDGLLLPVCPRCHWKACMKMNEEYGDAVVGKTPFCLACGCDAVLVMISYGMVLLMQFLEAVGITVQIHTSEVGRLEV